MYKRILAVLLSLIMVLSMTACGNPISDMFSEDDEYQTEVSKNINLAMSDIKTLNPVVSKDRDTYYISKLIYQSLFELDENFTPVKELVSKFTVGSNGKKITLELVKDAKFSDGTKVTSKDVVFSIECYKAAGNNSIYKDYVDGISSVEAGGKYKVTIRYEEAGKGGPCSLTFPILPAHLYSQSELLTQDSSFRPVGSGSYKVKSFKKNEKLILTKNDETNGKKPKNRLVFKDYKDGNILNLEEGNLVSLSVNEDTERQSEVGSKSLVTTDICSNELEVIGFNCHTKYLKKKEMRQAFAYAIDVDSIIKKIYYSSAVETDSIFYPGYMGTENEGDPYGFDEKKAESILKDADYKDMDKDGYIEDDDEKNLKVRIIVNKNNKNRVNAAKAIKENLESLDLNVEVRELSSKEYTRALKKGSFDIFVGGIKYSDYFDIQPFVTGKSNFTDYRNKKLDKIALSLSSCTKISEMPALVNEAKKIMQSDLPYYPICFKTYAVITSEELTGEISSMFNDIYRGCEEWVCTYTITNPVEEDEDIEE